MIKTLDVTQFMGQHVPQVHHWPLVSGRQRQRAIHEPKADGIAINIGIHNLSVEFWLGGLVEERDRRHGCG